MRARVVPIAMVGDLITLPLRLSIRTASFFLRSSEEVLKRALALTGRTASAEPRYGESTSNGRAETYDSAQSAPPSPTAPTAAPPAPSAPPEPVFDERPTPLVEEPSHVSEEATIVEEFAEPGAEDGVGAQVRIEEPWDGYANMSAKQVIARIGDASPAELAAIDLYESANQARQTVLSAVERQLKLITRDGASD
jgi:hypothetical protein